MQTFVCTQGGEQNFLTTQTARILARIAKIIKSLTKLKDEQLQLIPT